MLKTMISEAKNFDLLESNGKLNIAAKTLTKILEQTLLYYFKSSPKILFPVKNFGKMATDSEKSRFFASRIIVFL